MLNQIRIPELTAQGLRRLTGEVNLALEQLSREVSRLEAQVEALRKEQSDGLQHHTI